MTVIVLQSCSSQYPMLHQKASTEANELKKYCMGKGLRSKIVAKADSLYSVSSELMQKGKEEEAYFLMDLAVIHYRLALSRNEVVEGKKKIEKLKQSLVKAEDKLETYKDKLGKYKKVISDLDR